MSTGAVLEVVPAMFCEQDVVDKKFLGARFNFQHVECVDDESDTLMRSLPQDPLDLESKRMERTQAMKHLIL